jgi:hypothetical protein
VVLNSLAAGGLTSLAQHQRAHSAGASSGALIAATPPYRTP